MKKKYDFKNGVRGKFYRNEASVNLPVYLDPEVVAFLADRAGKKGVALDEVANEMLKRDIEMIRRAG